MNEKYTIQILPEAEEFLDYFAEDLVCGGYKMTSSIGATDIDQLHTILRDFKKYTISFLARRML